MKYGVSKQTHEHKSCVFKVRSENCVKQFLLKEIKIVDPRVILCVGASSFTKLQKHQQDGEINDSIKLINLIHYGKQAGLQLTAEDEENFIWPFQVGMIGKEKMGELSFFNK